MELLVYVRNHDLSAGRTVVGLAVGQAPGVETTRAEIPTSFVEVRIDAAVPHPATEIGLLVAKALAAQGVPGPGDILRYQSPRGEVRLRAEPGFDTARSICEPLLAVLQRCRIHGDTVVTASQRPTAQA
jgi:hypothetical protein